MIREQNSARSPRGSKEKGEGAYRKGKQLGKGSFGTVIQAMHIESGEQVAIKKVLQDPRYKNRELDILKHLVHPNIIFLRDYYYTEGDDGQANSRFLNVVMDYIPETTHRVMRQYSKNGQLMPPLLVKAMVYQLCRSVGYLHAKDICHRDIKPQNLLLDPASNLLKLCDFGSAKKLSSEPSVAYICSRYYRAPELMLGSTEYTKTIDMWSVGCVFAEFMILKPLFQGENSVDQLVKIIETIGTPRQNEMVAMIGKERGDQRFPIHPKKPWRNLISVGSPAALELLDLMLRYDPTERIKPLDALAHEYFDELRNPELRIGGHSPPRLFDFKSEELSNMSPETREIVIPRWATPGRTKWPPDLLSYDGNFLRVSKRRRLPGLTSPRYGGTSDGTL